MRADFYPTDSLEVFSEQDSMTKKDLWSKCTATTQEKLSYHQGKAISLWQFVLESTKVINEVPGVSIYFLTKSGNSSLTPPKRSPLQACRVACCLLNMVRTFCFMFNSGPVLPSLGHRHSFLTHLQSWDVKPSFENRLPAIHVVSGNVKPGHS